jgi:hypothetical protein
VLPDDLVEEIRITAAAEGARDGFVPVVGRSEYRPIR